MLHLTNGVAENLGRTHVCALERQLLACPYQPGMRLSSDGLRANMATATQTRHMFLVLPVMLLACHTSPRAMGFLAAFEGEAALRRAALALTLAMGKGQALMPPVLHADCLAWEQLADARPRTWPGRCTAWTRLLLSC